MTTATWISQEPLLGASVPGAATADPPVTLAAGTVVGPAQPIGTIKRFYDSLGVYGAGQFMYLPGVAALKVGDLVTYNLSAGISYTDAVVTRWAGTAQSGLPLAVAMTANTSTTNFSWYQVQGAAVCNITGTVASGDKAYWQLTGTIGSTIAAGKQVVGASAFSTGVVPITGQAVYTIDFPYVQSQIS